MSLAKDESLTVVIHGKQEDVMKARRMVVNQLQTQASITIQISCEHHQFIRGQNGSKLQQLELATATKITIPQPEDYSDIITIVGTKEGIDKAKHEIQVTVDEQVGFLRLLLFPPTSGLGLHVFFRSLGNWGRSDIWSFLRDVDFGNF